MEVAIRISYDEVLNATKSETFRILEEAFLQGIDQIAKVKLPDEFDHETFRADVARIFEDKDWYIGAVPKLPEGADPDEYLKIAQAS